MFVSFLYIIEETLFILVNSLTLFLFFCKIISVNISGESCKNAGAEGVRRFLRRSLRQKDRDIILNRMCKLPYD